MCKTKISYSAFVALAVLCGATMFTGCGDDSSTSVNDEQPSSSVEAPTSSAEGESSSSDKAKTDKSSSSSKEDKIAESSSSAKKDKSSSSANGGEPAEQSSSSSQGILLNPNIQYDTIVDSRDAHIYRTVKIGDQQWMAENMNYGVYEDCFDAQGDRCVDDTCSCTKYGRLYTWLSAIDDLCVQGWRLPTKEDFEKLFVTVGGDSIAGRMLKSMSDWKSDNNGVDSFGFTALPAGYRFTSGGSYGVYNNADFWCSTESTHQKAYYVNLNYKNDSAIISEAGKSEGFSIRCVKD